MENMREDGSIGVLNSLAWLNLFGGVLGAIIIFGNWGFIKTYSQTVFNPIVVGISIGLLIQGIFGCALLLVFCSIAKNLIMIRKNTEALEDKVPAIPELRPGIGMKDTDRAELKKALGDDATTLPYVTKTEWICSCGTHNPLDKSKKIQNCSNCKKNRDYVFGKIGLTP